MLAGASGRPRASATLTGWELSERGEKGLQKKPPLGKKFFFDKALRGDILAGLPWWLQRRCIPKRLAPMRLGESLKPGRSAVPPGGRHEVTYVRIRDAAVAQR